MTKERREELKKKSLELYEQDYDSEDIIKYYRHLDTWGLGLDEQRYVRRLIKRLDEKKEK